MMDGFSQKIEPIALVTRAPAEYDVTLAVTSLSGHTVPRI